MTVSFQTLQYKNINNWSVAHLLANQFNYNEEFELERIGKFLIRNKTQIVVDDETIYKRVTIRLFNKGIKIRDTEIGNKIGTKKQFVVKEGQFLMSKIDARNGAFGIATKEVDGAIITADFLAFDIDIKKITPQFLVLLTTTPEFQKFAQSASSGTTGRQRMDEKKFLNAKIPLPSLSKQKEILENYNQKISVTREINKELLQKNNLIYEELSSDLGISITLEVPKSLFNLINYRTISVWSVADLLNKESYQSKYPLMNLNEIAEIIMGNSPSSSLITNLKKGYKFIGGAADIQDGAVVSERYISNTSKLSKPGDILYLIRATIGNPILADSNYYLGRGVSAIRANENRVLTEFLLSVLKLMEDKIVKLGTGSTFKQISKPILENIKIPVPPIDIQRALVEKMRTEFSKIEELKKQLIQNENAGKVFFENEIFK